MPKWCTGAGSSSQTMLVKKTKGGDGKRGGGSFLETLLEFVQRMNGNCKCGGQVGEHSR